MPKHKKQSIMTKAFIYLFKAIYFILKSIAKAVIFIFKKLFSKAKQVHEQRKMKQSQPKTPAVFNQLQPIVEKKGSFEVFENRLNQESLIIAVAGRRGSGKSALGFRLLENIHAKAKRPAAVLGVSQSVLPEWIHTVSDIKEAKNGSILLVDEGAIAFSSRNSMSKENKELASLLAIARHKDLTLILITQNTSMIDKNVLNLCDAIFFKEGSLLQEKMERSALKEMYTNANAEIIKIPQSERKSHVYVVDSDFEGLIKTDLPSFWSSKVSKSQA